MLPRENRIFTIAHDSFTWNRHMCNYWCGPWALFRRGKYSRQKTFADPAKDMLLLADHGFGCYPFFSECIKTGASLVFRIRSNMKFAKEKILPDGSFLSTFYPGAEQRKKTKWHSCSSNWICHQRLQWKISLDNQYFKSGRRSGFRTCGSLPRALGDRIGLWWIEESSEATRSRLAKQNPGIDYTGIVWISTCALYDSQLNTSSRTEK